MGNPFGSILLVLIFASPAFVLPLIIGPIILRLFHDDELSKIAGVFTLKPLVATPLWALTLALFGKSTPPEDIAQVLSLIPAIGLTAAIVWRFKHSFKTDARIASVLVGADAVRWLNTFAWMQFGAHPRITDPFLLAGWILPNAYAVMALVILWLRARRQKPAVL